MKKPTDAVKLRLVKKQLKATAQAAESERLSLYSQLETAHFNAHQRSRETFEVSEKLRVERVGRRAMLESLRAERARLVNELYVCEQRLAVMRDTERGGNGALALAGPQVENDEGKAISR